ncbi:MAG: hypothetical protein L0Z54_02330 [Thermoplasmata archaeon]|nr:hypothetical protein [Thermoplasmata archaeon]
MTMALKRSRTAADDVPSHNYEIILGMPTIRKVSPRAEAVVEVVDEKAAEGGRSPAEGADAKGMSSHAAAKGLEGIVEALHELERFRASAEADLKSLRDKSDRMVTTISSMDDVRRSLYTLELRMQEIASLFDVLSLDLNPFVDYSGSPGGKGRRDEPFVSEIWILKWLEFLQARMSGYDIPNLLEHYKEIGWIDDLIESKAMTYLRSLRFEVAPLDKAINSDGERIPLDREESDGWKLRPEDTISSYLFIQRIKGVRVEPSIIETIDEEVRRLLEVAPRDILANVAFPEVTDQAPPAVPFANGEGGFVDSPFEESTAPPRVRQKDQNSFMEVPLIDEEELDRLKQKLDQLAQEKEG